MTQMTNELTGDLGEMAAQLSHAIRRDHRRRVRRRAAARTTAIVTAGVCALSGSALAAGEATGVLDLGGGHSVVPVSATPAPAGAKLPYHYQLTGGHDHNGAARGPIYIESSKPLTSLTQSQIVADRLACAAKGMKVNDAIVWVWDATCTPAH